jgi:hypothetical protein
MRSLKRRFTGHQFCPPPYRAKMRLHSKHYGQINWQFTFADSLRLPRHARACPMRAHTCTLRAAAVPASNSARPSPQRATPRGRLASDSARPSRERLRAAVSRATLRGRPSERLRAAVPGATLRGRLTSDSARTSQRATPHGRATSSFSGKFSGHHDDFQCIFIHSFVPAWGTKLWYRLMSPGSYHHDDFQCIFVCAIFH